MVNYNPFFALSPEKDPKLMEADARAAKYATSMVRWWRKVVEGRLEPDMEKGKPLCAYQYPLVFGVQRVPYVTRNLVVPHVGNSRHVTVVHRHKYYRVDVVDATGAVLAEDSLARIFSKIRDERGAPKEHDVGLFTAASRDVYGAARLEMERVSCSVNGASWRDIDTSLFVVVLEDSSSDSLLERGRQYLHGVDGSNRYFDKHQLIVHADGNLGMCLEHAANDGLTWGRMLLEVWGDVHPEFATGFSALKTREVRDIAQPRALEFDFKSSPQTGKDVQKAADEAKALADDVDSAVLNFTDFGRDAIKKWKVSPDAAVQMAFQLAYVRVNPTLGHPAVYESCAMKHFFHGRTETIRSATSESKSLVRVFQSPHSTPQQRRDALVRACEKHVNVANGARTCAGPHIGVDRHLLGLRSQAGRVGVDTPALFKDPAFSRSNTWTLSTSNVTTPFFDAFGFGAVTPLGYGLGYQTRERALPIFVTSFYSGQAKVPGNTGSKVIAEGIAQALRDFEGAFRG